MRPRALADPTLSACSRPVTKEYGEAQDTDDRVFSASYIPRRLEEVTDYEEHHDRLQGGEPVRLFALTQQVSAGPSCCNSQGGADSTVWAYAGAAC